MPRIARDEHAKIYERIEVNGEKVVAVAACYGCTSANIYAIISKLRRGSAPARQSGAQKQLQAPAAPPIQLPLDVEGSAEAAESDVPVLAPEPIPEPTPKPHASLPEASASIETTPLPVRGQSPVSASFVVPRGKGGYALMMRAGDGEEVANPFRSLEDLLAAAKPILRTAARSPEPIWFSIRPVDLKALEDVF